MHVIFVVVLNSSFNNSRANHPIAKIHNQHNKYYDCYHTVPTSDPNVMLNIEEYLKNEAVVLVEWEQGLLSEKYSVHLSLVNHSNVTITNNNSIRVMLSYNNEYNFSLVASNCKGSSILFSTTFIVGK